MLYVSSCAISPVPVTVQTVPSSGILHKKLGLKASLKCRATGFPKAFVTWYKLINKGNNNLPELAEIESNERIELDSKEVSESVQESSLNIDPVHRLDEGVSSPYHCPYTACASLPKSILNVTNLLSYSFYTSSYRFRIIRSTFAK